MSLLSSFFRGSKKVNLTPDIVPQMPSQINPRAYGDLSNLSSKYIRGEGTGFGDEYVDKNVNPVAQSMRRNFRNVTSPFLSSQYSARGIARSNLAADAQGQAEGDVESNIGNLMAKFFQLNEAQKKQDTQFGAQIGQNLLTGDTSAQHTQAESSRLLANATAGDARTRETNDAAKTQKLIQTALGVATGGATGGFTGALAGASAGLGATPSVGTKMLGKDDLAAAIMELLGRRK